MFKRPHHRRTFSVLSAMNPHFLDEQESGLAQFLLSLKDRPLLFA